MCFSSPAFRDGLRAVLLFEHESAFKTIDELVPTGMHVPWQALAGRKINNEHQRLLARHALQIGLKYLLGGGRIRCRCLRPSRGSDHRPACQKAAGKHNSDISRHLNTSLVVLDIAREPTNLRAQFALCL
jgi:hypothetical protein